MVTQFSPTHIANLKRAAKKLKRDKGLDKLSQAQDIIAGDNGFKNWSLLVKASNTFSLSAKSSAPVFDPGSLRHFSVRVTAVVRDAPGPSTRFWHQELPTKYKAAHYEKFRRIPQYWSVTRRDVDSAMYGISLVQREIAFMDATNLIPSRAFSSIFPIHGHGAGLDHFCVWRDQNKGIVVSNEPYAPSDKVAQCKEWCDKNGWAYQVLPRTIGMHNCCMPECKDDCGSHTMLILMSPPKNGGDVGAVAKALLQDFHRFNSTKIESPS